MRHPGPGTSPRALDPDWQLRLAAFAGLRRAADARGGVVTAEDLDAGFEHQGKRIRFWDSRRGIWRPRQLGHDGAALTVVTAPPRPGKAPPYDDQVGSEADYFLYRYEGTDPEHWTNAAVRRAYHERRPLIYLYGITPGVYAPVFPCSVVADDPANLAFHLMADSAARRVGPEMMAFGVTPERQYATAAVKVRLHQRRFRELVVSARAPGDAGRAHPAAALGGAAAAAAVFGGEVSEVQGGVGARRFSGHARDLSVMRQAVRQYMMMKCPRMAGRTKERQPRSAELTTQNASVTLSASYPPSSFGG